RRAYILIRAAWWGTDLAIQKQSTSYQDPMLALANKRLNQARDLARYPVDFTGGPRAEYVSKSVESLSHSLRLVQQVLVILRGTVVPIARPDPSPVKQCLGAPTRENFSDPAASCAAAWRPARRGSASCGSRRSCFRPRPSRNVSPEAHAASVGRT